MLTTCLLLSAVASQLPPRGAEPDLAALSTRCASELGWVESWDAAVERARRENRLILVHALLYPSFAISDEDAVSTLMDRDVQELVNARFVPFRLRPGVACALTDPQLYGIGPKGFGRGYLVVRADGSVVADGVGDLAPLLLEALRRAPDALGTPAPSSGDPEQRADALVRRGELDAAESLLAQARSARAWRTRARIHALRRDGERALAALERAREAVQASADASTDAQASAHAPTLVELDLDRAWLLARLGRFRDAIPLCRNAIEADAPAPLARDRAREARYLLAELDLALGLKLFADPLLRELVAGAPEDRWTWRAAGRLTSTHYRLGAGAGLAWPARELAALTPVFDFDALAPDLAASALEPARAWLLAHQREDGSWPSPTEIGSQMDHELSDLTLATTALVAEALLGAPEPARERDGRDEHDERERATRQPARERADPSAVSSPHAAPDGADAASARELASARGALERALAYALRSSARLRATRLPKSFLEYGVWSRTHVLHLVAAAHEAGVLDRAAAASAAADLVADLVALEKEHGGWSYYRTLDLAREAAVAPSMSFTTADVALALDRARAAGLAPAADAGRAAAVSGAFERGLDALERMRGAANDFAYWWAPGMSVSPSAVGDSGHGPLCTLALLRGGRTDVDALAAALAAFSSHARELARERGKSLMHCGVDGIGSHYVLFDVLWAARALRELPAPQRRRFREAIQETLLACRTTRGSFVDNLLIGESAGTALALLALQALRDE